MGSTAPLGATRNERQHKVVRGKWEEGEEERVVRVVVAEREEEVESWVVVDQPQGI